LEERALEEDLSGTGEFLGLDGIGYLAGFLDPVEADEAPGLMEADGVGLERG
jgi:hypothetical protein